MRRPAVGVLNMYKNIVSVACSGASEFILLTRPNTNINLFKVGIPKADDDRCAFYEEVELFERIISCCRFSGASSITATTVGISIYVYPNILHPFSDG